MAESEHNSSVQGPGLPGSPGFRSWKTIIPLVVVAISLAASVTFAYSGALIHAGGIASLGCVVAMLVYIAGRRAEERVHFLSERVRAQEIAQQHQQQLIRADKMAALGVLVSGVAHEINNPNQFILLNSSLLDEVWQSSLPILDEYYNENGDFLLAGVPFSKMRERMPEACKGVERGARHIKRIVQSLKDYARDDAGDMAQVFDVNAVVEASATLLTSLIRKSTNNFTVIQSGLAAEVKGNFQKLEQVVVNLVQNSCQALADPDKAISVEVSRDEAGGRVVLTVRDEGVGIPPENATRVFDPFFTTKRDSGGTGLGLSISHRIISEHGGEINFEPAEGGGTVATIRLPAFVPAVVETPVEAEVAG